MNLSGSQCNLIELNNPLSPLQALGSMVREITVVEQILNFEFIIFPALICSIKHERTDFSITADIYILVPLVFLMQEAKKSRLDEKLNAWFQSASLKQ